MTSLTAENIPKEAEIAMKEWAEHYRPVRQRTVRSETTKDKAGGLPLAVYEKAKSRTRIGVFSRYSCVKSSTTSEFNELVLRFISSDFTAVTFVSDAWTFFTELDEFESDTDSDCNETEQEETDEHRNFIKRLGRQIKASMRFDLW